MHPELRGRGLGSEIRAGVLTFAFETLAAEAAWSGASVDNAASNRVSQKLGYELVGHETKSTAAGDVRCTRLRLTADAWTPTPSVGVSGGERVRAALG